MPPPTIIPAKPRVYRRRITPLAIAPLVLVSVDYEPDEPGVNLVFDRAIDISAIDVSAFAIADGNIVGCLWTGTGTPYLPAPNWVQIVLVRGADFSADDVRLTVGAGNGIVAGDDGGTWAGCAGLVLAFP